MARRRKNNDDLAKNEELPMTPMIDIIFQLLIFFMCSMPFKKLEGKLNSWLPKDKGLNPVSVPKPELQEIRIAFRQQFRPQPRKTALPLHAFKNLLRPFFIYFGHRINLL